MIINPASIYFEVIVQACEYDHVNDLVLKNMASQRGCMKGSIVYALFWFLLRCRGH